MQHRRDFLRTHGLTFAGMIAMQRVQAEEGQTLESKAKRVIVIGAGLAGLAAARELQSRGCDVVVIEARERIGGRVWTSRQWEDMPLDLGATWIHGVKENPITEVADEIHAKRIATSYQKSIGYNTAGKPFSTAEEKRLDEIKDQIHKILKEAQDRDNDVSIREALESWIKKLGDTSQDRRLTEFILSSTFEQEYSGSVFKLSAQWYDSVQEFDGGDAFFAQGFGEIAQHLSRDLNIQLGQVVESIDWHRSPVRIKTQRSKFEADCVVVTLPLGVLQSGRVRFEPELPKKKSQAIASLGMGVLNKCYLRFERPFWPDDVDWLEYVSAKRGGWTEWVSFLRTIDKPILLGFQAADRGKEIEGWTDSQIAGSAMDTLKTIFGAGIADPVGVQITRWASDPFSLGSYSFNAVGSKPSMRNDLAASMGDRVYFAGEATEREYFGTTHGAYLSGLRAAEEILTERKP